MRTRARTTKPIACRYCGKKLWTWSGMRRHWRKVHPAAQADDENTNETTRTT